MFNILVGQQNSLQDLEMLWDFHICKNMAVTSIT